MSRLDEFAVVVFDLDDTLYSESDYVRSGFDHIGEMVRRLYGKPFRGLLEAAWQAGVPDAVGHALQEAGLPGQLKDHLVQAYRYHQPKLSLLPGATELLQRCRSRNCPLFLVTDGRSVTQRLKIEALGLDGWFDGVYISEEIGHGKPDPFAFQAIAQATTCGPWVYVADNPAKDFVAPHQLGWTTIGVRNASGRVHPVGKSVQEPTCWVDELIDLL